MAASVWLAVLFTVVVGKQDVMRQLCEKPMNPGCSGKFIDATGADPPRCDLTCTAQIKDQQKMSFCAEQLPYTRTGASIQGNKVTCKYTALQVCENGNFFVGKCVKYYPTRVTYAQAEAKCKSEGAILETFDSEKQKRWVQVTTPISEPAIWTKSPNGKALLMTNSDLGTAGSVVKGGGNFPKLTFYCSVSTRDYTLAHEIYCNALRTLKLPARFESNKCMVITSSLWSGTKANGGADLHNLCMNISPFDGRPAVNFREKESNHMKALVNEFHTTMVIQPTAIKTNDPFREWCNKNRAHRANAPLLHSFITKDNGDKSILFEIPYYTYVSEKLYPMCGHDAGQFKIASVGKTAKGSSPVSNVFSMPSACLIAPNLNNAIVGKCDKGWLPFEKYDGFIWCTKYIWHGEKNYWESQKVCQQNGGVITGFDNEEEYKQLFKDATDGLAKHEKKGSVWLAGSRKKECMKATLKSQAPCYYQEQFEWADGVTVGGFAFTHWEPGEPNNKNGEETLSMIIQPGNNKHGLMNDLKKSHTHDRWDMKGVYKIRGSFCGKRAILP